MQRMRRKRVKTMPLFWTEPVGLCFYCHQPLIADQPRGLNPRHQDGIPYGLCQPRLRSVISSTDGNASENPGF
jgi:hypothetical protein